MNKRSVLVLLAAVLVCNTALAGFLFDGYDDRFPVNPKTSVRNLQVYNEPTWLIDSTQQANLPGVYNLGNPGNRDAILSWVSGGDDSTGANASVGSSNLRLNNDTGVTSRLEINYGTYTLNALPLNANGDIWPGATAGVFFYFYLNSADTGSFVDLAIRTHNGEGSAQTFSTNIVYPSGMSLPVIPVAGLPLHFLIPVTDLRTAGGVAPIVTDIQDIDGIQMHLWTNTAAGDMAVNDFGMATPEPATMTLLGLGVLALVRRRRKS